MTTDDQPMRTTDDSQAGRVPGPVELMRLHVEALFTHDAAGDLVAVNEPDGGPAPRFFLGITAEGAVWRFRHDVDAGLRAALREAVGNERRRQPMDPPPSPARYADLLARAAPVRRTWAGPAYLVPRTRPAPGAVLVTEANAELLQPLLEGWRNDVERCQPMAVHTVEDRAVSVCCSVRRTGRADEAGVETAPAFRGRGHAVPAVQTWAAAVRAHGRLPLYSTSWENHASRALAERLELHHFGDDLHLT